MNRRNPREGKWMIDEQRPTPILVHTDERRRCPTSRESVAEMDAVLDRLQAEQMEERATIGEAFCPLTAGIEVPGYFAYLGLGVEQTILTVGAEDDWYYALGDENAEGEPVMFYGIGDDSYWGPKYLIPVGVARRALRYFIEHQQPSPDLKWEH